MRNQVSKDQPKIQASPHADKSGQSKPVQIASVMDDNGGNGFLVHHMTPAEEKSYNDGMARMAEYFG